GARNRIGIFVRRGDLGRHNHFRSGPRCSPLPQGREVILKPLQQEKRTGIMIAAAYGGASTIARTLSLLSPGESISSWSRFVLRQVRHLVDGMEFSSRPGGGRNPDRDRKSTRLNSSHLVIS